MHRIDEHRGQPVPPDYDRVTEALTRGNADELEELTREVDGFPDGVDSFIGRRWIINALDVGSKETIDWMLGKRVGLDFRDEEGYTPLHAALERKNADRYQVMAQLLAAGAAVNLKGINDWTPAHMAAAYDDVDALRILVRHGADLAIRTDIDHHATPLEEARHLGRLKAVKYLESIA